MMKKISQRCTNLLKNPQTEIQFIYGYYKRLSMQVRKTSIISSKNDLFTASNLPSKLIEKIFEVFQPTSVLDLGCGTGQSLKYMLAKGISDVVGIEGSVQAITSSPVSKHIQQFDLNQELNLGRKFDIVFSYEFVEHIHPCYLDNLLRSFSNHSDTLIISAAKPGQGGLGHFNEQEPEYWIQAFAKYGYKYEQSITKLLQAEEELYPENILVLKR